MPRLSRELASQQGKGTLRMSRLPAFEASDRLAGVTAFGMGRGRLTIGPNLSPRDN